MSARRHTTHGLSVIEALVAVAILGLAFSGLMSWRQAVLRQHQRIETQERSITAHRNALALLSEVNPMMTPVGVVEIAPGQTVAWRATALSRPRRSRAYPAGDSAFNVVLFRLDVRVDGATQTPVEFEVERLGWAPADGDASSP